MQTLTRRALRVTAALSELRQANGDVLDALIPFFEPILDVLRGKVFDPSLLGAGVQKLYRWRFTTDVAEQFIPRLVQKGYLRREGRGQQALYIVTYEPKENGSLPSDSFDQLLNEIVDRFEEFAPVVTDLLHYHKSRDELTDILIRFLLSIGAFGDGALVEAEQIASAGASETQGVLSELPEGGPPLAHEDRYIAARFVVEMCEEKPAYLDDFRSIAAVGLLTEVAEDFIRPTSITTEAELTIVIDAPLALDYLGLSGTKLQDDVRAVFGPLQRIGCRLIVFPVTCDEMRRNLEAMLALPQANRHGYTHQAMVRGEVAPDVVTAVARNPEAALENAGIGIRNLNLSLFPADHQYFSAEVYEDFLSYVHWVDDLAPRVHDATCMALLMRLRRGRHSTDLFRSRFVFVTRNQAFARRSREYCLQSQLIGARHEGPVIHHRELATLAWLRTGLDAEENIPRASLIAACERVLRVRREVTTAVAERLSEVTTREKLEQFELLLLDQRSLQKLADTTLNDERVVTDANAEQLLEIMRQATAEEARAEHRTAMQRELAAHREAQRALAEERDALTAAGAEEIRLRDEQIATVSRELEEARSEVQQLQGLKRQNVSNAVHAVNRVTGFVDKTATYLILIVGLAGVAGVVFGVPSRLGLVWLIMILPVIAGIYFTIMDILQKPKIGLGDILNALAKRLLGRELQKRGLKEEEVPGLTFANGRIGFDSGRE